MRMAASVAVLAGALGPAAQAGADEPFAIGAGIFLQDGFFESFSARLADQLDRRMRHARHSGGGLHVTGLKGPDVEWNAYRAAAEYDPQVALQFAAAEAERELARERNESPFGPAMALPPGLGIFLLGDTGVGQARAAPGAASDFWTHSISGGLDYRFADALLAGFAVSYSGGEADLGRRDYASESMTWSLFASLGEGPWHVDGSFNMGTLGFGGVQETGALLPGASMRPAGTGEHVWTHVDTGYAFRFGNMDAGPVAEFRHAKARFESGEDILPPGGREVDYARLGLGASAAIDVDFGERQGMNIWGRATWQTGFGNADPAIEAVLEEGGAPVLVQGLEADRSFVRTQVGLTADLGGGAEADFSYRTDFAREDWNSHTVAASITVKF